METQKLPGLLLSLLLTAGASSVSAGEEHDHNEKGQDPVQIEPHNKDGHDEADNVGSADEDNHGEEEGEHAEEEDGGIRLNEKQQAMINLQVSRLKLQLIASTVSAPGEVVYDRYRSSIISPQADVRVIQRHVILGDHVKKGQPLVTLFSDELADRMTDLRNNAKEWELVKKMGRSLAGKQRFSQAQAAVQKSTAKVQAFGLSKEDIKLQVDQPNKHPLGQFVFKAPHQGVIQQDRFLIGQQMSSGDQLFTLVDESEIWIEAQLPANQVVKSPLGTEVSLQIADQRYTGTLIQLAHNLNESTRTRMARIAVDNTHHNLHPGQFAQVAIPTDSQKWAAVLPEAAFTRTPDGDWGVFVEAEPGEYKLEEVEVIEETPGARVVSGLEPGTPVVTQGTFFLASEQAKAGFDIHNH